ncbi:MAG TPA: helix-turn-helix domain-containing protein [Streptosporangiales bacterium]
MFESVGVDPDDELAYRALLRLPQATEADLAGELGWPQPKVRGCVGRLEDLGMLSRTADRPARLVPARPDVAVDVLVARRRAELDRTQLAARELLAELVTPDRYGPEDLVEVVVGQAAVATRFAQLLEGTEEELLVLDRPPYAAPPDEADTRVRDLLGGGVRVLGIYSPDSLEIPGAVDELYSAADAGEESRVHAHVPIKLAVSDRSLALLPFVVDEVIDSALVVHRSALLEALTQLFFLLWQQATPPVPTTAEDRADLDGRMLTLLAAGLKDDAIARQLGLSSRTVGRRIAALLERLGARTRFQAGVAAQRRGLFDDAGDP